MASLLTFVIRFLFRVTLDHEILSCERDAALYNCYIYFSEIGSKRVMKSNTRKYITIFIRRSSKDADTCK